MNLINASKENNIELVKSLLENGVNANLHDKYNITALMMASNKGHISMVKLLLQYGANTDAQDSKGMTALMYSTDKYITKLLLESGADPDIQNKRGRTALMIASNKEFMDNIKVLFEYNADPNIQDNDGWTSLMDCTYKQNIEIMKLHLQNNADVNIKNKRGFVAYNYSKTEEVADVLLKECGEEFVKHINENVCPICLDSLNENINSKIPFVYHNSDQKSFDSGVDDIAKSIHMFHKSCINFWMKNCPLCRQSNIIWKLCKPPKKVSKEN